MNIPIASPSRELQLINNFHERFNSLLNDGIYIGGSSVTDFENNMKTARTEEDDAQSKYQELKASKTQSLKSSREMLTSKKQERAENTDALADARFRQV